MSRIVRVSDLPNQIMGKNIEPKFLPVRAGDVFRTLADISKIKKILQFKPQVNFEEGLKETVEYFKKQLIADNV